MTSDNYEENLRLMDRVHFNFPDLSFGEVVQVSIDRYFRGSNRDASNVSNKEYFKALEKYINDETSKRSGV